MNVHILLKWLLGLFFIGLIACKSNNKALEREVEVSCGQCNFNLPGDGCDLAVRFNDTAYFVDGTHIDEYGDAHAEDGFCQSISSATVIGEIKDNRYQVYSLELNKKTDG